MNIECCLFFDTPCMCDKQRTSDFRYAHKLLDSFLFIEIQSEQDTRVSESYTLLISKCQLIHNRRFAC